MRKNLLYYHPKNADILLYGDEKRKVKEAERYFSSILGVMLVDGGCFCEEDGLVKTLHKKYSSMLKWIAPLGIIFFICMLCFAVGSEFPDNSYWSTFFTVIGVILIIPSVALYIILGILMWRLYNYKRQLLKYYLESYSPRCTNYDDDFRDELANAGYDTMFNQAEIEDGMNYSEELSEAEQELYSEKCVCIACKSRLSCADVTDFEDYTAICPECGKKAIIPDLDNDISEDFLYALNKYWCGD